MHYARIEPDVLNSVGLHGGKAECLHRQSVLPHVYRLNSPSIITYVSLSRDRFQITSGQVHGLLVLFMNSII